MRLNKPSASIGVVFAILALVFLTSPATAQICGSSALGTAGDFNLFVLGDMELRDTGTGGRLAAGGQAQMSHLGLGQTLSPAPGGRDDVIIGGDIFFDDGEIFAGNLIHGGTATIARVNVPNGVVQQGTPIDFDAEASFLKSRSAGWAGLTPNGNTEVLYGGIYLTGSESGENVFAVDGADLATAWGINITVPAGSSVLVNIDGTAVEMSAMGFNLQGVTNERVVYNFHEAMTLDLSSIGVQGSIVAPDAFVTFSNGNVDGTLAAGSFSGAGFFNNIAFAGCLPDGQDLACGPPADIGSTTADGPEDVSDSASTAGLLLESFSETTFNDQNAEVVVRQSCNTLDASVGKLLVYDNEKVVPYETLVTTSDSIRFSLVDNPSDGRHDLLIAANDTFGGHLLKRFIVWAGTGSFTTRVLDSSGNPVADAIVTATISDDENVQKTLTTDSQGEVLFENLPVRSYNVVARTADNRIGFKPHSLNDGTAVITLLDFGAPSSIDNNDFSQGLDGWEIGTSNVTLIDHVEGPVGTPTNLVFEAPGHSEDAPKAASKRFDERARLHHESRVEFDRYMANLATKNTDFDLQLATSGEGPRNVSRTFAVAPGAKAVRVRYRFITTEVPGGYFGSQYNDFFNVSIRSENAGGRAGGGNSMNGLGLQAFDSAGATGWNEVELPVAPEGDNIRVDLSVANVADGLLDSFLVVDAVKATGLRLESVSLLDLDNSPLKFFSAAEHSYFGGNIRVNGTITLRGPSSDSLSSLDLRVIRGGQIIATGNLPASLQSSVLKSFGSEETIQISSPQLLFEIPSSSFSGLGLNSGGNVTLKVVAITTNGDVAEREVATLTRFARYTNSNRYGERDEIDICAGGCGGDDWVKPSVRQVAAQISSASWGDFSNMHGGLFPPHNTHRTGNSADGWIDGYGSRDATIAQNLFNIINAFGSRIRLCGVTFTPAFQAAIQNMTFSDGRRGVDVFVNWADHAGHFHFEVTD